MRFARIPDELRNELTPQQQAEFLLAGGGFRSRSGATRSTRDGMADLGVVQNPNGGLSKESNWRAMFGEKPTGETRRAFRPIAPPVVDNNPMANPVAPVPPQVNGMQAENNDTSGDYWWQNPMGEAPDLSTPDALLADATNTSTRFLNKRGQGIAAPAAGQVQSGTSLQTPYGTASVRNAWDTEWST